jgi:hypothetical protein
MAYPGRFTSLIVGGQTTFDFEIKEPDIDLAFEQIL